MKKKKIFLLTCLSPILNPFIFGTFLIHFHGELSLPKITIIHEELNVHNDTKLLWK